MYIVEFLQDSQCQIALVIEEMPDKLRILLPNRREQSILKNRTLPWLGPQIKADSKDEMVKILASHADKRKKIAEEVDLITIWELAQGEIDKADIKWLAEILVSDPSPDYLAGLARALIQDKTHFRFSPPIFEIYPEALVSAKKEANELQKRRERFLTPSVSWVKTLFECQQNNKALPACPLEEDISKRLQKLLLTRIGERAFEDKDDELLWQNIIKTIPEDTFAPYLLARTWGIIPEHYNYWLDRAQYSINKVDGTKWYEKYAQEVESLKEKALKDSSPLCDLPFVSIDGVTTKDIDDAFYLKQEENTWKLSLAFACPAAFWEFESPFDKVISQRATSLYLPEATYHMLPEPLGIGAYSLFAETTCPALLVHYTFNLDYEIQDFRIERGRVCLAQNLNYTQVEQALTNENTQEDLPLEMLKNAYTLSQKLLQKRIENNAVILERPDPQISLEYPEEKLPAYYENVRVCLQESEENPQAQLLVSEFMVLANSTIAEWANTNKIPLFYRTQDIVLPKEYAGIWRKPEDVARIVRSLSSASIETQAKPHAGMGLNAYAPITSPLRRYTDLVNEAQVIHFIKHNEVLFSQEKLNTMLLYLNAYLESVTPIQRMRPRYWKLLYCKQESKQAMEKGDDFIWKGIVTEEFEHFYSIAFPKEQLFLRAKRNYMPEKVFIGQELLFRFGKINPLRNEIQIIGAEEI